MNLLDTDWLESAKDKRWLVGVSGGRDSVALLHACVTAGLNGLVVAHVNHGLRGKESDGDADFVRNLADDLVLPFCVVKADVGQMAEEEKKSIELAAREARHRFFAAEVVQRECEGVLLAHHADDQAETVLFNLLRGSAGLRGMQKRQFLVESGLMIYRPMLDVTREEIDAFISEHGLGYREDSSNADDFATRNRIRNEAMPLLEDIMGRKVAPAVVRALNISEKKEATLEGMVDYESLLDPQGRLFLPRMEALPVALQELVMFRYLREQRVSDVSQELVEAAVGLLDKEGVAKINLPRGRFLRRKEQRIFLQ